LHELKDFDLSPTLNRCSNELQMVLKLIVHREFDPNPFLQQNNIKNAWSQITRKILLFQKKSEFSKVRRNDKFFIPLKFRLILCLSSH
jgi:hypothetical protein